MGPLLLTFCSISLILSCLMIAIEIFRDPRWIRHQPDDLSLERPFAFSEGSRTLTPYPLDLLISQLKNMGYVSSIQQLDFVNWALHTDYLQLRQVTVSQFHFLFSVTRQHRVSSHPSDKEERVQPA